MLQQTQVDRVVPRFEAFVKRFPTLASLADARPGDVLREWKGLGYNARAVRLHGVARAVVREHGGKIPRDAAALRALPGIGAYTASAIRAFAYDLDDLPVDVNVGRVLRRIGESARAGIRTGGYAVASALMDLGALICTARAPQCTRCPLRDGCAREIAPAQTAAKAARVPFERTARYARGRIVDQLRELDPGARIAVRELHRRLRAVLPKRNLAEIRRLLEALHRDGLVALQDGSVSLP